MPSPRRSLRSRFALTALTALAALALAATLAPAASADELAAPGEAPAAEAPPALAPPVSIQFTQRSASLAGSRALVHVKCAGGGEVCIGTLALQAPAGAHKVPFSIDRGEDQILVVPLGPDGPALGMLKSVRVVARTLQSSGGSVDTSRVLRIR